MRWLVTNLSNFIYLFRGCCLFWGFLGFFNPFLYQQASYWDRKFLQVPWGWVGLCEWPPSDSNLPLTSALLLLTCCLLLFLFLAVPLSAPPPPLFLLCSRLAVGSCNAWHSPRFVFRVLLFPSCEAQRFPMSAVVSGLPFRKAKADVEILSRPVGKCSPAIAINTVPFPLLLKGTPNRKVSAVCTTSRLRFNSLAPTSLSCLNKAASAFFAKCSLSLEIIASRGLPLRVFTTAFFPLLPREMLVVLDSEIIDVDFSIWKYVLTVIKVNKNVFKDSINRLV